MMLLVPTCYGHMHSESIERSIAMQTTPIVTLNCSMHRMPNKRVSEANARKMLRQGALTTGDSYYAYKDSDVYFTSPTDVEDCCRGLDEHPDWDAVALDTKGPHGPIPGDGEKWFESRVRKHHIPIAFFVIRREALERLSFSQLADENVCLCRSVNREITIRYLDYRSLGEDRTARIGMNL